MRGTSINLELRTADRGSTALHCTLKLALSRDLDLKVREKMVDLLLQQGASIGGVNTYGYTILHTAAASGLTSIVRQLIDAGADVNYVSNRDGFTPLLCAVRAGHVEVVKLLLEKVPMLRRQAADLQ
jgi:ankyrin repeat protein